MAYCVFRVVFYRRSTPASLERPVRYRYGIWQKSDFRSLERPTARLVGPQTLIHTTTCMLPTHMGMMLSQNQRRLMKQKQLACLRKQQLRVFLRLLNRVPLCGEMPGERGRVYIYYTWIYIIRGTYTSPCRQISLSLKTHRPGSQFPATYSL